MLHVDKPSDCTCEWPEVRYRNGSGHDRWTEEVSMGGIDGGRKIYTDHKTYANGPPEFVKIAADVLGEKL